MTLDFLCPIIRFFYHFKFNCDIRAANLIQFDFHKKESDVFIGVIVQPFDCCTMFFSRSLYDPNHDIGRFAGCIGYQFTQVVMIGILKLIFNNNFSVSPGFRCKNINVKISHTGLGLINGNFQPNSIR